jgi:hypothetical protein
VVPRIQAVLGGIHCGHIKIEVIKHSSARLLHGLRVWDLGGAFLSHFAM